MTDNDITAIVGWPTEPEMVKYRKIASASEKAERERIGVILYDVRAELSARSVGWLIDADTPHKRMLIGSDWQAERMGGYNELLVTISDVFAAMERLLAPAAGAPARIPDGQASQHVLKAEAATPDATDRECLANASPDGGPMGAGQPAAAGPAVELTDEWLPPLSDVEPDAYLGQEWTDDGIGKSLDYRLSLNCLSDEDEPLYAATQMRDYAHAAIELDRKTRGAEVERLKDLLAETASSVSLYFNDVKMDDEIRPDAHELWRRCMVALGYDSEFINSLKRSDVPRGAAQEDARDAATSNLRELPSDAVSVEGAK